jgi:SPP1 family predicted phage head-tail adaptor
MSAGRRDKKVTIQRQSDTQDSVGQLVDTWTVTATVYASIEPLSAREYFNASGERAEVTHKIGMVYGPTISPRDRVVYGSRTFEIRSVINIEERNRELQLMCTERVT